VETDYLKKWKRIKKRKSKKKEIRRMVTEEGNKNGVE
jgi:hypothetical protein